MRATRRRVHRSDLNSGEIIEALRKMGCLVVVIGRPTDLLVGVSPWWFVAECKQGKGKYTEDQQQFLKDCETFNLPFLTLRSVDKAIEAVNSIRATIVKPCK